MADNSELTIVIRARDHASAVIEKVQQVSDRFGSSLQRAEEGSVMLAAGVATASAAVLGFGGAAIKSYANYEQLIGGVETLFKQSSDVVKQYAQNAYQTAGLSANQYMDTITSFTASLLQGLGGNTAKAAEVGNMAVIDMADNANKMGTAMESIQYAYQGFAKDNFTMLDNLKLGYGGTQAEMARLVNESGVLGKSFKATAENVSEVPFDKIIESIHVVQTRLGITGTTAKEASSTIAGSFNATKAAWETLSASFGTGNSGQIQQAFNGFIGSSENFLRNIVKILPIVISGIGQVVKDALSRLPENVRSALPAIGGVILGGLVPAFLALAASTWAALAPLLPFLAVGAAVAVLANRLADNFGGWHAVLDRVKQGVSSLGEMVDWMIGVWNGDVSSADLGEGKFRTVIEIWERLIGVGRNIAAIWSNVLWPSIKGLGEAFVQNLLPALMQVRDAVTQLWNALNPALMTALKIIGAFLAVVFVAAIWSVINGLKLTVEVLSVAVSAIANAIHWVSNLASWFGNLAGAGVNAVGAVLSWFGRLPSSIGNIVNTIVGWFDGLPWRIGDAVSAVVGFLTAPFRSAFNGIALLWNNSVGNLSFKAPDWVPGIGGKGFSLPKIPMFAKGVEGFEGGLAITGEKGPELAWWPRGTNIMSNDDMKEALSGQSGRSNSGSGGVVVHQTNHNYGQYDMDTAAIKLGMELSRA